MSHEEFENAAALEAIGAASPEESAALRRHLAECAPCRGVMGEMSNAAAAFALSLDPVQPPPAVRARIMQELSAGTSRGPAADAVKEGGFTRWLLPLAAILAIALLGWSQMLLLGQREKVEQAELRARESAEQAERLASEKRTLEEENQKLNAFMAAMSSSATRTISLGGQPMAPSASARVFLDPSARQAFVFFHDLPANPEDKSYQLWVIPADGRPLGVGVFDVNQTGSASMVLQNLPVATEIKALAVTMEPKGGLPAPSGEMYLMGGTS